jgi:ATP-dependent Clp protease adaptor protein ClpS
MLPHRKQTKSSQKREFAMASSNSAVAQPENEQKAAAAKPKRQPRYNVILWDDPEHTYDYVITMMRELFFMTETAGRKLAEEVDKTGRAICLTTTLEHAELKRDQIKAYGRDPNSMRSKGSMSASIEPAP